MLQDRIAGGLISEKSYAVHAEADFESYSLMDYSASAMTPVANPVQIEVRKEFPETWLFESFDFNSRYVDFELDEFLH